MVTFFKRTQVWAVEYQWDGRTRHWLKALPEKADATALLRAELRNLFGDRARLISVRQATADEELDYVRGNLPRNAFCPTGNVPLTPAREPEKSEPGQADRATQPAGVARPAKPHRP